MNRAELYLHNSRLNSSFFTRLALSYIFLLILVSLLAATTISIGNLRFGNIDFYSNNEIEEEYEDARLTTVEVTIKKGDNINRILQKQPISIEERQNIIALVKQVKLDNSLQVGRKLIFEYDTSLINEEDDDLAEEYQTLRQITYEVDNTRRIEIIKKEKDIFIVKNQDVPLRKVLAKYTTSIHNSVLESAKSLEVSTNSIIELINIYSHQVDFQRQVKEGDELSIIAEKFYTEEGEFSHHGKIIFASLTLSGKKYNIYRYSQNSDDKFQYFSEEAQSVTSNLLRTPIKVMRITSHFGKRVHPIDGYTRMHTGVDFAAPIGTPIYAAGDGVVTEIGWKGGYGKYVKIQHNDTMATAYAHASKFAKNLRRGSIVKQGQVIAYVGNTGKSTNPHLHYEVLVNNSHINPLAIKTTPKTKLVGSKLVKFENYKKQLQDLIENIPNKEDIIRSSL
ncbi:MAG: nlpD2 [Rickettsiaceae bacterium]|jgi:murein DD-endopeptidase MepM/ murein hydrolase activator NlpD|nr:nlpD2 [Rickettsiaceae bacterium]